MTCEYCETGQCPCGAGCSACEHTGACSECHGRMRVDPVPPGVTRRRDYGATAYAKRVRCATCRRATIPREAPTREWALALPKQHRTRALTVQRCVGCHAGYSDDVAARPNTYRLQEAS